MQNVLNHVLDQSSHLTGNAEKNNICSCDVIHDVFVLFTFAKVEVILFYTFISDQSLALLHIHTHARARLTALFPGLPG